MRRWISNLLPAMHVCPAPMKPPYAAPRAATSIGVSSKMRTGDLPPSSSVALANRFAVRQRDRPAGLGAPGEDRLLDQRVFGQRGAGCRAEAGDDVEHAVGNAGFLGDLAEEQRGERRLPRRLEDDRVSGGQRRREALRGDHHRVVEREQDPEHVERSGW
jgi:hypothetical protein